MQERHHPGGTACVVSGAGALLLAGGLALFGALACSRSGKPAPAADTTAPGPADAPAAATDGSPAATPELPAPTPDVATAPAADAAATDAGGPEAGPDAADAPAEAAEVELDTAGLPPAEAELRRLVAGRCPPYVDDGQPDPEAFTSDLKCTGSSEEVFDEYEACEKAWEELSVRLPSQHAEVDALLRERRFLDARRSVRGWLGRRSCPSVCNVPPLVEQLARAVEVAFAADGAVTDLAGTWLERPVRVFVEQPVRPQTRPDPAARLVHGYPLHANRWLDAWAYVPGGWVLVADPMAGPTFRVWEPPSAVVGWVPACTLALDPAGALVTDVGHPITILRPPATGATTAEAEEGGPCTKGGKPGRFFAMWADERIECFPYVEMCGGPGLTPPTWDLRGPDEETCGDCCTNGRCVVEVGDWCRARAPGSTWQCSADNTQLVCVLPSP
jgi:hypothetical protein